jgi:hypothetical protein
MDRWYLYTTPLSPRSGRRSACSDVETDKQVPPVIARSAAGEASLLVPEHMDDPGWLSPCYLALCQHQQPTQYTATALSTSSTAATWR